MNYENLLRNLFLYFNKRNGLPRIKRYAGLFLLMTALLCLSFKSIAQSAGTAPVNPPTGGFAVDGNLEANIVVPGIGDWLPGNAGSGGYVMNSSGTPLNPGTTFHLIDLYNSGSDNNFAGGKKFNQDPNAWTWVSNPVNGKEDINNALLHFSTDALGHTWLIFAADRMTNTGEAYIDFEFLQNTLNTTGGPTSGGFTSAGPDGGRTLNDFVLTLELTNGGSTANFFVDRWESVGAGFDYVDKTSSLPAGAVYAAVNTSTVPVSFGAFGSSTYSANTFVEGGVDLTALLGSFSNCTELGIKTLLIKTKESASPSATIVDFVNPIQVALTLGVANAGPDQSVCSQGASTDFNLNGQAIASLGDIVTSTVWSVRSGAATIDDFNSLTTIAHVTSSPATLRLTVTTQKGCTVFDDIVLTVSAGLTVTNIATDATCKNANNGSIDITVAGGVSPFMYDWADLSGSNDPEDRNNLAPGNYSVLVTDNKGCQGSTSATISEPQLLSCSVQKVADVKCKGESNGSATVTPTGGNGDYTYLWDDNETTATATMLNAGKHTVTVTDLKGCTSTCDVTISEPDAALSCSTQKVLDVKCKGESNGSATVTSTGGNGGYTYLWDDNETTATATMLNAGKHTVTVTDLKGCTSTCDVTISEPDAALSCSTQKVSDVKCKGESNGSATVIPTGGNGGYTYLWDDNETTATATMLNAGSHSVSVTDSKGCTSNCNVTIYEPIAGLSIICKKTDVSCNGGTTGAIDVTVTGGTAPYTYDWSDLSGTDDPEDRTGLTAGTYTVVVTDAHGCTTQCESMISQPSQITTSTAVVNASCNKNTGSIDLTVSGGSQPYTYLWSNGATTEDVQGLAEGMYSVTITDAHNCTATTSAQVSTTQPPVCSITKPTAPLTCNSAGNKLCATVTGGTGNIQYKWKSNNTAWVINSGQGTNCITYTAGSSSTSDAKFILTVTDANGCKSTCSINVSCGCSFVVNGVAKKTTGECFKLTTSTAYHTAGSVFSTAPVNLKKSFQINASLYFGVNDSGGDGIAFVLQNEGPHYIGDYGAGIGYNRFDGSASCMPTDNPGPVPSFIVEFDTYQNQVVDCKNVGDPAGDHIAFMSHSNSYHTSKYALSTPMEFPSNIEDGQYHDALFDWNATTQTMTVTFTVSSNPTVIKTYTYTGDIVKNLFKGNPYAYFGFTASNGSVTPNEHRVCIRTSCAPDYYTSQSSFATSGTSTTISDKSLTQENIVSVFPNPFNTHLSFNFKSPQNGKASLELFDLVGKKLAVIYDGELKAQTPYSFDYTVPAAYRVPMMYKLTIGSAIYHGFVLPQK